MPDEPQAPNSEKTPPLEQARMFLKAQQIEPCVSILHEHWAANVEDVATMRLAAEVMKAVGQGELSEKINKLADSTEAAKIDPQSMFEVGFALIDIRWHPIASALLEKCVKYVPDEPMINYELGFALMSQRKYSDAIANFLRAWAVEEDFDTALNLTVSYICTRQMSRARDMLQEMQRLSTKPEHQREIARQTLALRRLEDLKDKPELNARDWLFAHYGSVLLTVSSEPGLNGRFRAVWNDYNKVAANLLILRGVLEGLGVAFDVVEYYSSLSRPLAEALGQLLNVPSEGYQGPKRDGRALLVMAWASDIVGPHEAFIGHQEQRSIFAYGLAASEPLPLTPEVVACVTDSCAMPWAEHWKIEEYDDGRPASIEHIEADERADEVARKILDSTFKLEADPDILHSIQECLDYYRGREDFLVLNNSHLFLERPEYTAEVP